MEKIKTPTEWFKSQDPNCTTFHCNLETMTAYGEYVRKCVDPGWIDVKKNPPEEMQECFFIIVSTNSSHNGEVVAGRYQRKHPGGRYHEFSTIGFIWRARYWQPLPEPPQKPQP